LILIRPAPRLLAAALRALLAGILRALAGAVLRLTPDFAAIEDPPGQIHSIRRSYAVAMAQSSASVVGDAPRLRTVKL
jgi:hypothetical protein